MPFKFYIEDLSTRTEVEEPDGWKDIESVLERDFEVHGMFFSYTDGTVKLGFACDAKELLEPAYQTDGTEAYFLFEVEQAADIYSAYSVIFSGEIDFDKRDYDEDIWSAEVNESSDQLKLKNRSDLKMNLNKGLSLDGVNLSNVNYDDTIISLATKEFKQLVVKNDGQTLDSVQSTAVTTQTFLYGNIGFLTSESNELKRYSSVATELSTNSRFGSFLIAEDNGALAINFDIDIDINFTEDQGSGTTTYTAALVLRFDKPVKGDQGGLVTQFAIDSDVDVGASPNNATINLTIDTTDYAIVTPGTKCSVELTLTMDTTGTAQFSAVLDITKFDLTITDKIGVPGTQSQWYHLHDALNKNLNFITNEYDYLYSELLGDQERGYSLDGCFSETRIINGFRVRQINDTEKAPIFSFKDFISNLNTISAVGYGTEELLSPVGIGSLQIATHAIVADELTIDVDGDITSYFDVSDEIAFFDNEFLYGSWPVTSISYAGGPDETEVIFDVTGNISLHNVGIISTTAYVTTNKNMVLRNRLRVEKWEHFYSNNQLIDLGVVEEYSEDPFSDILYNELTIKFNKYSNDEGMATTLEEIHTESGWALPLTKSKKNLSLALQWIGSTFLFNDSRDRIFSKKPTTSHVLDNDIFFCDREVKSGTYTVDFNTSPDFVTMPADAYENIISGSNSFSISGATEGANNGVHDIDTSKEIVFQISTNKYLVSVTSTLVNDASDEVLIEFSGTNTLYKPESNENLLTSSGITRPTYIMNQRRTMKRFLIRWGSYINSILAYLTANVTIQNLFYVNNGDFTSEIDSYDMDTDCVDLWGSVREADNINSDDLGQPKFKPNIITITQKICNTDYQLILDAHKNKLAYVEQNYGYFTVTSPRDGKVVNGWLMKMKRNPIDGIAKIELLEKA